MGDMQAIMKLESLPNEIIFECFKYLNAIDVFYSFDYLNSRFSNIIKDVPLHLDIKDIKESELVQFCIKILLNPQIKNQIISLKLSQEQTYDPIQTLFSFLSINEFSQLRSLILIDLDQKTVQQILPIIPLLTNLHYLSFIGTYDETDNILDLLLKSTSLSLLLPRLDLFNFQNIDKFSSIVNLTISHKCKIEKLCEFFQYVPMLKYLKVENLERYFDLTIDELRMHNNYLAYHLKQLIINELETEMDCLEILFNQIPNLEYLMIMAQNYDTDLIDARHWQHLITNSLPFLNIFKFKFDIKLVEEHEYNDFDDKFQSFQNNFWHQLNRWDIECARHQNKILIYTVPYISDEFKIAANTKRYYNTSVKNVNAFYKVTDLTLFPEVMTNTCEYYFPNITSLRLQNNSDNENHTYPYLKTKHVQCLKNIVNLSNVTYVEMLSSCTMKSPSVLLHLLKDAPNIAYLAIDKNILFPLFGSRDLVECLNKMIKKLDVTGNSDDSCLTSDEIKKVCQIFSDMTVFRCNINSEDNLRLILKHLSTLLHMKKFVYTATYRRYGKLWLQEIMENIGLYSFKIQHESNGYKDM